MRQCLGQGIIAIVHQYLRRLGNKQRRWVKSWHHRSWKRLLRSFVKALKNLSSIEMPQMLMGSGLESIILSSASCVRCAGEAVMSAPFPMAIQLWWRSQFDCEKNAVPLGEQGLTKKNENRRASCLDHITTGLESAKDSWHYRGKNTSLSSCHKAKRGHTVHSRKHLSLAPSNAVAKSILIQRHSYLENAIENAQR